jgi:hypothetical protein
MNEYKIRGTRDSDGTPVASRICARNETELERVLSDYGITLESSELVGSVKENQSSQSVSLGCGTLILIALIVMIFSADDDSLRREIQQLQRQVQQLKSAMDAQTRTLEELKSSVSKAAE